MDYRERVSLACAACDTSGEGWAHYHGGPALKLGTYAVLPAGWARDGEDAVCAACAAVVMVDEEGVTEVDPDVTMANVG